MMPAVLLLLLARAAVADIQLRVVASGSGRGSLRKPGHELTAQCVLHVKADTKVSDLQQMICRELAWLQQYTLRFPKSFAQVTPDSELRDLGIDQNYNRVFIDQGVPEPQHGCQRPVILDQVPATAKQRVTIGKHEQGGSGEPDLRDQFSRMKMTEKDAPDEYKRVTGGGRPETDALKKTRSRGFLRSQSELHHNGGGRPEKDTKQRTQQLRAKTNTHPIVIKPSQIMNPLSAQVHHQGTKPKPQTNQIKPKPHQGTPQKPRPPFVEPKQTNLPWYACFTPSCMKQQAKRK
jgi:hypothetical protein